MRKLSDLKVQDLKTSAKSANFQYQVRTMRIWGMLVVGDGPFLASNVRFVEWLRSLVAINTLLFPITPVRATKSAKSVYQASLSDQQVLLLSGAKPQLLDRLRCFEKEILGATPPPSPPIQKDEVQVISSISPQEQHKDSLMLSHGNGRLLPSVDN